MFGKIFASMYEGTLHGQWQAIITMQQLVVLADSEGYVDMTAQAISSRTSIPLDIIEHGLTVLSEPDSYSRNPIKDGRRIELIDPARPWGWRLVNHAYYRDLASKADKRNKDRLRIAEKRDKSRVSQQVAGSRGQSQKSPIQKQDTKATKSNGRQADHIVGHRFADFWAVYPRKVKRKQSIDLWKRKRLDQHADAIIADVYARIADDPQWKETRLIPHPTSYMNAERWYDEWREASAPEDRWKRANRIAKERGIDAFRGAPHETPEQFMARVGV